MTELKTDRLLLREFIPGDEDPLYDYMHVETHWRHVPIDPPTPDSVAALVRNMIDTQYDDPRNVYDLIAVDKHTQAFVGHCSLHMYRPLRLGTIGWGVTDRLANQGMATEMGAAMLRLAFGTFDLHRVQALCRDENHASRRVMAKLGMREEGIIRDNLYARGEWWSSVQSAILSTDAGCWSLYVSEELLQSSD